MGQTILVPLDGSRLAEQALPEARRVARAEEAALILVSVVPDSILLRDPYAAQEQSVVDAEAYMHRARRRLERDGFSVTVDIHYADPAESILAAALQWEADLIVMSTHGRSGVSRAVLGSVAERVLHGATMPVLLVRAAHRPHLRHDGPYRTILIPLDRSERALGALHYVRHANVAHGATVLLLHSVPPVEPRLTPDLPDEARREVLARWQEEQEHRCEAARQYLEGVARRYLAGHTWRAAVTVGDPAEGILGYAADGEVELIVMATHGRLGIERLMHGSVAAHVLHHTDVPVLLLHGAEAGAGSSAAATAGIARTTTREQS